MTLEKLLIFGLGVVVLTAFATWSGSTGNVREAEKTEYKNAIDTLMTKTP
jgi:hypothetical protein